MPYPNKNRSALPTVSLRGLTGPRQSAAPTVSLRGAKRRGNPFFWQLVLAGTAYMEYGLPRPLRGLAMTSPVVPAPKRCHCEEAKPTWQSPGTNGRDISAERYFPEIATAPMGPRNDRCGRWPAPGLRSPLSLRGDRRPTWQSVLLAARPCGHCLYGVRIATAPSGPRNDKSGSACPQTMSLRGGEADVAISWHQRTGHFS